MTDRFDGPSIRCDSCAEIFFYSCYLSWRSLSVTEAQISAAEAHKSVPSGYRIHRGTCLVTPCFVPASWTTIRQRQQFSLICSFRTNRQLIVWQALSALSDRAFVERLDSRYIAGIQRSHPEEPPRGALFLGCRGLSLFAKPETCNHRPSDCSNMGAPVGGHRDRRHPLSRKS